MTQREILRYAQFGIIKMIEELKDASVGSVESPRIRSLRRKQKELEEMNTKTKKLRSGQYEAIEDGPGASRGDFYSVTI